MGCNGSTMTKEEKERQKVLEAQLRKDKKAFTSEIKLLLLGAGESGKSTIAKQMKIIHKEGFSADEKKGFREVVFSNIVSCMKTLCMAADNLDIAVSSENEEKRAAMAAAPMSITQLPPQMAADIKALWVDEGIQATYAKRNTFQLTDSASYYFDSIDRIADPNYLPTEQDVLRSRVKTTGITEIEFEVDEINFRMVDVGGQRSERKKWIHCFQDVTAVIFCVAMSEYDLRLYEDETVSRADESLKLFDEICNSKWFNSTSIILFLNKSDLFKEKIQKVSLSVCFPEYKGGLDYQAGSDFLMEKFTSLNKNQAQKTVYPHITCATDTDNIRFVFDVVKDIILHQALDSTGFY